MGLLASLAPDGVVVVETFGTGPQLPPDPLTPCEERTVARATPKRRREFEEARRCARAGLRLLGHHPTPVPSGPHGEPQWPVGVVGSITHCEGYRAAVVTWTSVVKEIGIDAEPLRPLPPGVLNAVSTPIERENFSARYAPRPDIPWDLLIFCAKEAVFKAYFPSRRLIVDPSDILLSTTAGAGSFEATITARSEYGTKRMASRFAVEFKVKDGLLGVLAYSTS